MAKDKIGNVLKAGDKVLVSLNTSHVIGKVREIHEGGTIIPGRRKGGQVEAEMTPGEVVVDFDYSELFDPARGSALTIIKLADPDQQKTGLLKPN